MKKLMVASALGFALLVGGVASAECKCKQNAQTGQAQASCCQNANATKTGWFTNAPVPAGGGATGGQCSGCSSCKEKAQGQAPSGGSSQEKTGSCCQQQK